MRKCVFCKTRYKKGSKTSFHRFPSELRLRNMWLQNMNAFDWTPKETDYLCSKHFGTKCFVTHNTRTALKSGSVPTLFEVLFEIPDQKFYGELDEKSYSEEKIEEEESQLADFTYTYKYAIFCEVCDTSSTSLDSSTPGNLKSDLRENIKSDHDYESSRTPKKTRIEYSVAHDHRYESTPKSSEKSLQRTKRSLKLSNARVKTLTQRVKRLKMKVTDLKTVINDLI